MIPGYVSPRRFALIEALELIRFFEQSESNRKLPVKTICAHLGIGRSTFFRWRVALIEAGYLADSYTTVSLLKSSDELPNTDGNRTAVPFPSGMEQKKRQNASNLVSSSKQHGNRTAVPFPSAMALATVETDQKLNVKSASSKASLYNPSKTTLKQLPTTHYPVADFNKLKSGAAHSAATAPAESEKLELPTTIKLPDTGVIPVASLPKIARDGKLTPRDMKRVLWYDREGYEPIYQLALEGLAKSVEMLFTRGSAAAIGRPASVISQSYDTADRNKFRKVARHILEMGATVDKYIACAIDTKPRTLKYPTLGLLSGKGMKDQYLRWSSPEERERSERDGKFDSEAHYQSLKDGVEGGTVPQEELDEWLKYNPRTVS